MIVQEEGRQLKWSEEGRGTFPDKSFGYLVETFIVKMKRNMKLMRGREGGKEEEAVVRKWAWGEECWEAHLLKSI